MARWVQTAACSETCGHLGLSEVILRSLGCFINWWQIWSLFVVIFLLLLGIVFSKTNLRQLDRSWYYIQHKCLSSTMKTYSSVNLIVNIQRYTSSSEFSPAHEIIFFGWRTSPSLGWNRCLNQADLLAWLPSSWHGSNWHQAGQSQNQTVLFLSFLCQIRTFSIFAAATCEL